VLLDAAVLMQPRSFPPLIEAFLIVEQPRQRLSHWTQALAPLDDGRAPPLATITAYYDPSSDQALLGLRYDELALGQERLAFVIEVALLAEIGMIQPAELSDGDRRRFLNERLSRCTMHVSDQRSVVGALSELVRRVREQKQSPKPLAHAATPPPIPAANASMRPRGTTEDPVLLVQPKSTRDDLPRITRHSEPQHSMNELKRSSAEPASPRGDYARHTRRDEFVHTPSPNVIARPHRAEGLPLEAQRMAAEPRPQSDEVATMVGSLPAGAKRRADQLAAESYFSMGSGPTPPGIIYARYLRSGRWVPIRIGALSLKGAALMAGALPRLHDHVDIALSYSDHRALVRGSVRKVSSIEEVAMSGAATFTVAFELEDGSRQQLTSLLTAARTAQVTIKPPPPRGTRRYPVEWPVCLGTTRGAVRADALDISREGMFVRPIHPLTIDTVLNFSMVLDDGNSPVSGRAKVVRQIHEAEARTCGLAAGYGLQITEMNVDARSRWTQFLSRIERRAEKRVLIGATPARLTELQAALAAAGYAVTGGTDPGALVQLAGAHRPVDAVLIDAGWLAPGTSQSWIESLFSARNVPCVTMQGDARRGRTAIDKLLSVV